MDSFFKWSFEVLAIT